MEQGQGLTRAEIDKIVKLWIGVQGGYLGDFSYNSHDLFWLETCSKAVDTHAFEGTTRECFIATIQAADPHDQASALEGIIGRFPLDGPDAPAGRTEDLYALIRRWMDRLRSADRAVPLDVVDAGEVVRRALADADVLLANGRSAVSAVDRVHTALHGYLKEICRNAAIPYPDDPTITYLLRLVRENHPALSPTGPRQADIARVLQAHATVLDALNPLRNRASIAHANDEVLDDPEARLVVNTVRTVFVYLVDRLRKQAQPNLHQ